jgi:hypothetical protein
VSPPPEGKIAPENIRPARKQKQTRSALLRGSSSPTAGVEPEVAANVGITRMTAPSRSRMGLPAQDGDFRWKCTSPHLRRLLARDELGQGRPNDSRVPLPHREERSGWRPTNLLRRGRVMTSRTRKRHQHLHHRRRIRRKHKLPASQNNTASNYAPVKAWQPTAEEESPSLTKECQRQTPQQSADTKTSNTRLNRGRTCWHVDAPERNAMSWVLRMRG